jgi:hypothetical protein
LSEDKKTLECIDLNVVNGCQSLTTIYKCSEDIQGHIYFLGSDL